MVSQSKWYPIFPYLSIATLIGNDIHTTQLAFELKVGKVVNSHLLELPNLIHILRHTIGLISTLFCSRNPQVISETMVAIGDPRDAICDAVDQLNPTFLIVGSHGYGAIKRCHMCFSQIRLLS